ncbi:MAG: TolC family protein [Gemmataceae bacterium]|nr:TolC family protein [Gemmataceae bacterium]
MKPLSDSMLGAAAWIALAMAGPVVCSAQAQSKASSAADAPAVFLPLQAGGAPSSPEKAPDPRAVPPQPGIGLEELIRMAGENHPALRQAQFDINAARGRAIQAGLYPNPTVSFIFDELGDRTGPQGVNTLPLITQEIVTARKLQLSRAATEREVDQAALALTRQRLIVFTAVRQAYFDALAVQRRLQILRELVGIAEKGFSNAQKLLAAEQAAKADVLQFQIDLNRNRSQLEAAEQELLPVWRQLASSIGAPDLPVMQLQGSLDLPIPAYDLERTRLLVSELHPEVIAAQVGITRAEFVLQRQRVEPIPNVTVGAAYVRQNQNKSSDYTVQFSMPIPVWNRNQGNIRAAEAELGKARLEVGRVQSELTNRAATAFRQYAATKKQAERYRISILPAATEAYQLNMAAFRGGQFEYLKVLVAQRSIAESNLEYVRFLAEQWRAASEIAGLLQEDAAWPAVMCAQAAAPAASEPKE